MEARLGARLINRSTRKLTLTAEGQLFHERTLRLLADLDEAESAVAAGQTPRGRVRINSNVPFGLHHLLPLVPRFTARHPQGGAGHRAQRHGRRPDGRPHRRRHPGRADAGLAADGPQAGRKPDGRRGLARLSGSPRGPGTPGDLAGHNCIGFNFARHCDKWPFVDGGQRLSLPIHGDATARATARPRANWPWSARAWRRLSHFHICPDIAAGRLVPVLEAYNPGDVEELHAVYVGHGGQLPSRVRALIDFLVEAVDLRRADRRDA
jgi:DNA-binding transcriptional LysR family regulator